MIVISDTSPIINLAMIGRLSLLHRLYGRVIIPEAVRAEIQAGGPDAPGSHEVTTASWIEVVKVSGGVLPVHLAGRLDRGETEALALALELQADLVLLDERAGRAVAAQLGLRAIGLVGVIIAAKQKGLVPSVKTILDELQSRARFRLSEALYEHALEAVGE